MTRKRSALIVLLVLGIALIGGGLWVMRGSTQVKMSLPEGSPVVYERLDYVMRGEFNYLYIYEDGSIIYIEEKGLRQYRGNPTRTWKTGKLAAEQMDSLLAYFEDSGLDKLDEYYNFPGIPIEGGPAGGFRTGDMMMTITVTHGDLNKTVKASSYLTPDKGETYPDMPPPLNEIYIKLRAIAAGTEEVYRENITQ